MPRQFKNDPKTASRKQDESSNDNSEFFLLSNFDQTGNSVAADIDPEILREEEEQSARQAATVEADDQQNSDRTGKDGIKSNSRVLVDHGKRNDASGISLHDNSQLGDVSDSERDLGLLNNKSDFKMLQMAVDAAKLIEASDGDEESLLARKKDIERYLNASENSRLGDKSEQDDSQQQKQSFQFGSGYQQGDGQNSAHNLFGHNIRMNRSHDGQGDRQDPSSDLSESYSQYLRTNPESKIHQQQLRNLRQQQQQQQQQQRQQQTMTGIRNTLNNVLSQEQIAAAAAAAGSGAAGSNSLLGSSLMNAPHHSVNGKRRIRLRWSEEETKALIDGCKMHGVGNWKKILTDTRYRFNNRTAVDLKDRFRTSFPEEYSRLYPNARTHKSKRKVPRIDSSSLVKINRKERRSFTPLEDQRLLEGFERHGAAWSKIQRDESLGLGDRRSTDLRDRFRNAFPERYIAAGYKGRGTPKRTLQTLPNDADDNSYIKHNLDSTGTTNSVSYPLISSLVGTASSYGQGDGTDRGSSSGQVPMSPTFKAAAAAFANSNIDAELADAKHQEDVMSSIKLEGLNEDDDDDDVGDTGVLTEAERREIIQRQVELEQLRMQQEEKERQQQGQNGDGGKSDSNGTSSYSKQRRSRSASPTLIAAAAAAAAAAASVTETTSDSISATNGAGDHSEVVVNDEDSKMVGKDNSTDDNKSGDGKSTDNENAMNDSGLTESLYNGLFYNGSGQSR